MLSADVEPPHSSNEVFKVIIVSCVESFEMVFDSSSFEYFVEDPLQERDLLKSYTVVSP